MNPIDDSDYVTLSLERCATMGGFKKSLAGPGGNEPGNPLDWEKQQVKGNRTNNVGGAKP
jgi:hypothetical protein